MRVIPVFSLGEPVAFNRDPSDPLYWLERLAYEQSKNLYNLQQDGFEFEQGESTDFDSVEESLDTYASSIDSWFASAMQAASDGLPIPSAPSIPDIVGGVLPRLTGNPWIFLLAKIAIHLLVKLLEKRLDPDTSGSDLVRVLNELFRHSVSENPAGDIFQGIYEKLGEIDQKLLDDMAGNNLAQSVGLLESALRDLLSIEIEGDLDTYTFTISQILDSALIQTNDPDSRFSLLHLLARRAIEIILAEAGEIQQVNFVPGED